MRVMGGWIALTPELSAKLLLGRHVWDCAQHADLWGKRLPELRAPAQVSEPPNERFVGFMELLESPEAFGQTPERLVGIYRVLKPHLLATYEHHLAHANAVYEPPTRRILERTIEEERRHVAAGLAILARHLRDDTTHGRAGEWQERLRTLLVEAGGIAGDGVAHLRAPEIPPDPAGIAGDLVELEKPVGKWPLPEELEATVEAHGQSLTRQDLATVAKDLMPEARSTGEELYRSVVGWRPDRHDIVGVAQLGAHRQVKLRLSRPERAIVLLLRWVQHEECWRVAEVEVARAEDMGEL